MHWKNSVLMTVLMGLVASGCSTKPGPTQSASTTTRFKIYSDEDQSSYVVRHLEETIFTIKATKWHDGARGAISLTYDAPWGVDPRFKQATNAAIKRNLCMDMEMVTSKYLSTSRRPLIDRIRRELLPNGVHVFGHGHTHVRHDELGFDAAYESFKTDFGLMVEWGLKPRAYAYPHSSGKHISTQLANKQAGFIAARGGTNNPDEYYICPDDVREPDNWYFLPSVVMGIKDGGDIPSHQMLAPILARAETLDAWIILMYHSIGVPEGWAYYPLEEFERNLDYIADSSLWSGNLDDVAAYIQERNSLDINVVGFFGSALPKEFEMTISDHLDNAIYDQPLTFDLTFNPEIEVQKVYIDPSINGQSSFRVTDDQLRLHMVPDEKRYTLALED
ncbi:MAG: hypothetical protein HOC74_10865 [Gemmatimonadetes bacterium]|jgi:hypothetical protein|nr:hypothetical protein [Gemmatimonadota bacterium]